MKFQRPAAFVRSLLGLGSKESLSLELCSHAGSNSEWYKSAVGGMWDEIGRLQLTFMLEQGLRPEHYLLDVGCGSLRGGIHFIRYLEPAHYFGVDGNEQILAGGRIELNKQGLLSKQPLVLLTDSFDFSAFNRQFEYAWAFSLFTHLPVNSILRCILSVGQVLAPGGKFFATFFENPMGKFNLKDMFHPRVDGEPFLSFFDKDPYHYDFGTFEWICEGTDLKVAYIGNCFHPRDQKMLVFTKI